MNRQNLRVFLLGLGVAAVGAGLSDALARLTVRAEPRTDAKGAGRCAH